MQEIWIWKSSNYTHHHVPICDVLFVTFVLPGVIVVGLLFKYHVFLV